MEYDIAIIGGGPAGYNAAEKAAINGLKTVLLRKMQLVAYALTKVASQPKPPLFGKIAR